MMGPLGSLAQIVATQRCRTLMVGAVALTAVLAMAACANPTAPRAFRPTHPCADCRTPADTSRTLDR